MILFIQTTLYLFDGIISSAHNVGNILTNSFLGSLKLLTPKVMMDIFKRNVFIPKVYIFEGTSQL